MVNGDSAAGALVAAGIANDDDILVLHDVLSCGAVHEATIDRNLGPWQRSREAFWARVWESGRSLGYLDEEFTGFYEKPRNLYEATERLATADSVVICAGGALSDVLMAGLLLSLLAELGKPLNRVERGVFFPEDAHDPPICIPHLEPEVLAARWQSRPLDKLVREAWRDFWSAWVETVPAGAVPPRFDHPAVRAAAQAWDRRVIGPTRDLAAWDRRLLDLAIDGATVGSILGAVLREAAGDADPVGDLVLLHRLCMLGDDAPGGALLRLGPGKGRDTACEATDLARSILAPGDSDAHPRLIAWASALS